METRSYSRYILVVLCVAIVCTALILVALNAFTNTEKLVLPGGVTTNDDTVIAAYKAGFDSAQNKYEAGALLAASDRTNVLSGPVEDASASKLLVMQKNLAIDSEISGISDRREVLITENTKFYRETPKEVDVFTKEQAAYDASEPDESVGPPSPTIKTAIRLADIKTGDMVRVTTVEENIIGAESMTASEIVVTQ
ncbi:MAG: hypothetical protein WC787_00105 [Patescibacteria group bacterium]|jgi:hypothetical protein